MYFEKFNPNTEFTKWAALEVADHQIIPNNFSSLVLNSGLYSIFLHKGLPSTFPRTMQFIFGEWLPNSEYDLDNRPHFEMLGANYKNNDPTSEEEVWIPIRKKM
jgi:AraC family transcriptional regulator